VSPLAAGFESLLVEAVLRGGGGGERGVVSGGAQGKKGVSLFLT